MTRQSPAAGARARSAGATWRQRALRIGKATLTVAVPLVGAVIGLQLTPPVSTDLGPVELAVEARPSLRPATRIEMPPIGTVDFATHVSPLSIVASLESVDPAGAQALIASPEALAALEDSAGPKLTRAAVGSMGLAALFAGLGAAAATELASKRSRQALIAGGTVAAVVLASGGLTAATFRPQKLTEPQFEGLLSQAPALVDMAQLTFQDFQSYRSSVADLVGTVSSLYTTADGLPQESATDAQMRLLHVSDIHLNPTSFSAISRLVEQFDIDAVLDTGDVVSWGTPLESQVLTDIAAIPAPYYVVSGNHDSPETMQTLASLPNVTVLENEVVDLGGVQIAGIGDPRDVTRDNSGDHDGPGYELGKQRVANSAVQLGETIETWEDDHPGERVDAAMIHDATRPGGLLGRVPLILSGHTHTREVVDEVEDTGTMRMTQGSTGGGFASTSGIRPLLEGTQPLDLQATLLNVATEGEDEGDLLSYEEITIGGLGLLSVSIQHVAVTRDDEDLRVPENPELITDDAPDPVVPSPPRPTSPPTSLPTPTPTIAPTGPGENAAGN